MSSINGIRGLRAVIVGLEVRVQVGYKLQVPMGLSVVSSKIDDFLIHAGAFRNCFFFFCGNLEVWDRSILAPPIYGNIT